MSDHCRTFCGKGLDYPTSSWKTLNQECFFANSLKFSQLFMRATTNGRYFLLLSASIVDSLILINNLSTERAQFMKVLIRLNALFSSLHAVFFKIIFVYKYLQLQSNWPLKMRSCLHKLQNSKYLIFVTTVHYIFKLKV